MLENVQALFNKKLSTYEIAKQTGVAEQTVRDLRNGKSDLANAKFKTIKALNDYYAEHFTLPTFNTVTINTEDIEKIEVIKEINANNDSVVGRDEGDQKIVVSKINGIVYSVAYEYDGVADGEKYFTDKDEAYRYADYLL
ncbi:hypothetical protein ACTWQB_16510 [Piscibacillus sp. B03]|uniref:hypothetical protein n=1 Tax=Piscibacillus sp. B03 TaxID=3457430 RepID=UPI003FCD8D21